MFKNTILTLKTRGVWKLIIAIFYFIKIILFKILKKKFIKKNIYNFNMFLDVHDKGISRTLLLFGERELDQKFIIERILEPESVVLDLGSNIGYYALLILKKIDPKNIILVEPSSINLELLKKNLLLNNYQKVESHLAAISDSDSKKEFYLSEKSNLNSFHIDPKDQKNFDKIIVNSYSLPSFLKKRKVDLIRMDVEGHEVSIFKSLKEYISKYGHKPTIVYEPHMSKYNKDNDIAEQLKDLFKLGYSLNVASSSSLEGKKKFLDMSYQSIKTFKSDEKIRDIFLNISNKDALNLLAKEGGVRTALLSCKNEQKKFN
jgi:FkbM family methyltransferase